MRCDRACHGQNGTNDRPEPGRTADDDGRRPIAHATSAAWAAYGACAWALIFALPHLYWALGGRTGLRFSLALHGSREEAVIRDPWFVATGLWGVAGLCILGAVVALAAVRPSGRVIPRWILLAVAWSACAITVVRALLWPGFIRSTLYVTGTVSLPADIDPSWIRWDLALWSPWFLVGGILFGVLARTLTRRAPRD